MAKKALQVLSLDALNALTLDDLLTLLFDPEASSEAVLTRHTLYRASHQQLNRKPTRQHLQPEDD